MQAHNGISGIDNVRPGGPESEHPATAEGLQGSAAGHLQQNQNPGNGFHAVAVAGVDQHPHGHPQGLQHAQYYAQQMCYGPGIPFQYLPGMPGTGGKEHDAAGNGLPPVNMQPDPGKPSWGNHGEIGAAVQGNHATQGGPPGGTAVAGGPHGGMTAFYGRSFVGSASEGQHSSLIASTATLTSVTKMTWTDFQKYALLALFSYRYIPRRRRGKPSNTRELTRAIQQKMQAKDNCTIQCGGNDNEPNAIMTNLGRS